MGFFSWVNRQIEDIDSVAQGLTEAKHDRYLEVMDELSVAKNKMLLMQLYAGSAAEQCNRAEEAYSRACEKVDRLEKLAKELK